MISRKAILLIFFFVGYSYTGDFQHSNDEDVVPPYLFKWIEVHALISGIEQSTNIYIVNACQTRCLKILNELTRVDTYAEQVEEIKNNLIKTVKNTTKRIKK